jgi:hypothetical protein
MAGLWAGGRPGPLTNEPAARIAEHDAGALLRSLVVEIASPRVGTLENSWFANLLPSIYCAKRLFSPFSSGPDPRNFSPAAELRLNCLCTGIGDNPRSNFPSAGFSLRVGPWFEKPPRSRAAPLLLGFEPCQILCRYTIFDVDHVDQAEKVEARCWVIKGCAGSRFRGECGPNVDHCGPGCW